MKFMGLKFYKGQIEFYEDLMKRQRLRTPQVARYDDCVDIVERIKFLRAV